MYRYRKTWLRRQTLFALLAASAFAAPVPVVYAQGMGEAGAERDRTSDSQGQRGGVEQDWRDFRQDGRDGRQGYWRDKGDERSDSRRDAGESRRDLRGTTRERAELPNDTQEAGTARRELNNELQRRDQFARQLREAETAGDRASVARWRGVLAASNAEVARYQRELRRHYAAQREDRDAQRQEARDGQDRNRQRAVTAGRDEGATRVSLWKDRQP